MHEIFSIISRLVEILTGKKLFYVKPNKHNNLGKTAVWCELGFWYVGNVYDSADIAYGIAQNGIVEKEDTEIVVQVLSELKKPVVYDIGANTGYYGILAATKFNAVVHSFEPVPAHIECIEESSRINGIRERILLHPIALGNHKGNFDLILSGSGSSFKGKFLDDPNLPKMTVSVERLDALKLPVPHFIKIDVEGYEWEVVQGASETIKSHRPICFIEIAKTFSKRNFIHQNWNDIMHFFYSLGYKIQRSTPSGLVELSEQIPDGVQMYLFTPIK